MVKFIYQFLFSAGVATLALAPGGAEAAPAVPFSHLFDEDATPDVIFGSGNDNGSFTVNRGDVMSGMTSTAVELGLRAKVRYNSMGAPENTFNSDGAGTYEFSGGMPPANRAQWNFEWSINTDTAGTSGIDLDDFTYLLSIDLNPLAGVETFLSADPINGEPFADHALGDNSTGNGDGMVAVDATDYAAKIASLNVAQNSSNYGFFLPFTAGALGNGEYKIRLEMFDPSDTSMSSPLAGAEITVIVTPEPATYTLLGSTLGLVALRKRKTAHARS